MATVLPQDTPIRRASIADMSIDQVLALVEQMQERRMRQHTLYEAAMAAKAKIKEAKDRERFDHLLKMIEKKLPTIDKSLETVSKYLNELKVLELVLGG
jgi:carbamoylphosphate synthase large subunit